MVDVLLFCIPRIELQPVAAELLAHREPGAHPAAADVLVHGDELTIFQTGFHLVIGWRARETRCERRLACLDQLDRTPDLLGAVGRREDFVVVLLAAETAANQTF